MRPSMGSVGDCFDNAMCESFFATLECELLDRRRFKTQVEARMAIFDFIEGWYNPHRRHSALDYHSPIEYEQICRAEANQAEERDRLAHRWAAEQTGGRRAACAASALSKTLTFPAPARIGEGWGRKAGLRPNAKHKLEEQNH